MSNFAQELTLYDENDTNPFSIQHATTGTTMTADNIAIALAPGQEFIVNNGGDDHKVIPNGTCQNDYLHWDLANSTWKGGGVDVRLGCGSGVGSGADSVSLGNGAGIGIGAEAISIGTASGAGQGQRAVCIGFDAGKTAGAGTGEHAVCVGDSAGKTNPGHSATCVGRNAGLNNCENQATCIGSSAGQEDCGEFATCIGCSAGSGAAGTPCGTGAVMIGNRCGQNGCGNNAVALGNNAGANYPSGFIPAFSFTVNQIRAVGAPALPRSLNWDQSTGEIYHDALPGGLQVGTKAAMLAIASPSAGDQFMISDAGTPENNKLCYYSGRTWQVSGETFEMKCDGNMDEGYAVQISSAGPYEVELTTTQQDRDVCGVGAWEDRSNNDYTAVAIHGIWPVAVKSNTYDEDEYIRTSSNAGIGEETSSRKGVYAKVVEAATVASDGDLLQCFLHHVEMD